MEATVEPIPEPAPALATLADLPFHVLGRHPKPMLVGQCRAGQVVGMSTRDWFDKVRDLALGLGALGVGRGDRVAIMSESRPEWLLADMATQVVGAVNVPVYSTLTGPQARYILQDSGARVAFVSTAEQLDKLQRVRHELPKLQAIVTFEPPPGVSSPSIVHLDTVAERGHARLMGEWGIGRAFRDGAREIKPADLATIIYTSGTTGEPKGVMLSHGNIISNLFAGHAIVPVDETDMSLSFLPLSHSFERTVSYVYLANGVTIVFAESMDTIGRDMQTVRPTVMTGVPRVYEKFKARIFERGASLPQPRRTLFFWGTRVAMARARAAQKGTLGGVLALEAKVADKLVFAKIRESVGGRLRVLVSGSAPLPLDVAEFFAGIGLPITEGYGLTETSPIVTANPMNAPRLGTVGKPIPGVEVRIAEDGEILVRGPNVMLGYHNKPDDTALVLRDGWFHTGDVGAIDADGYLAITDRKKDLLVTSGGKKIAPQPIEAVLKKSPLIAEVVVLGDRRRFASALIVPEFKQLERRLQDLGRPPGDRESLVVREDVVALYKDVVDALNEELSQFERIKRFRLLPREFTIEAGELTPTLKVRRRNVEQNWRAEIEKLYE
jgi:long-chain acyl-CoA synthetase